MSGGKKPDRTKEMARLFSEMSQTFDKQARIFAEFAALLGGAPPAGGRGAAKNGATGAAPPPASNGAPANGGPVANDRALDASNGNPTVRFSPNRWNGDSFNGCAYSECPPDFLEVLAEALEYSAAHPKTGKENYAAENARCAALAWGWAARIRRTGGTEGDGAGDGSGDDPGAGKEVW